MRKEAKKEGGKFNFKDFVKSVNLLAEMIENKQLKITFAHDLIGIDAKTNIVQKVAKKYKIKLKELTNQINLILGIMYNILTENEKDFIEDFSKEDKKINEKMELVKEKLINKEIIEKYILNITYKTNILEKIDWEIIQKYYNKDICGMKGSPLAVLRFRIRHALDDIKRTEEIESFVFECTEHGIDELKEEINEIKKAFVELKKSRSD